MTTELVDFVPTLRGDNVRRDVHGESVVWSPVAPEPIALDPVATVMLDVIDGMASVGELALDVHEAVGVPLEDAQRQVTRVVELFASTGILASSTATVTADEAIASRELFLSSSTPCSENASRIGTVTLPLRLGDQTVRVACDSRRGARTLRDALADHVVESAEDAPLAFVLTAPQGLRRSHRLVDRAGFVLSEARGLEAGLHALASHLTALLPPAPGTARIRARTLVSGDKTVVCLAPLLFYPTVYPTVEERDLVRGGWGLIDRLALDVDVETGRIVNPEIPWPALRGLAAAPTHVGTGGTRSVTAIVRAAPNLAAPSPAAMVSAIASGGTRGSVPDLLDAAISLVRGAELHSVRPDANHLDADHLIKLLDKLGTHHS